LNTFPSNFVDDIVKYHRQHKHIHQKEHIVLLIFELLALIVFD